VARKGNSMSICDKCPYPKRCQAQARCIAYKNDAKPVIMQEPESVPVMTSTGIGMTGTIKQTFKKKAKKK
jgi:hypothetical protein